MISSDRLALFEIVYLDSGTHESFEEGACALELVSYVAGEPWSDHPECVCPVLGAFFRSWDDELPDYERNAVLRPFLSRLIGTRGSVRLAERRALMAADWLVRVRTSVWLRLAKLDTHADALAALPEITSMMHVPSIRGPIEAARAAAGAAAWAAARDAASVAAWAAWAAARDAAWGADWAAARDADWGVRVAAWAARDAARGVLKGTRDDLMKSAAALADRMILADEPAV